MTRRAGDFSALWPALTPEARGQIEADVATIAQAEHVACCRRLCELVRSHASRSEGQRLLAFLKVAGGVDLLEAVKGDA